MVFAAHVFTYIPHATGYLVICMVILYSYVKILTLQVIGLEPDPLKSQGATCHPKNDHLEPMFQYQPPNASCRFLMSGTHNPSFSCPNGSWDPNLS